VLAWDVPITSAPVAHLSTAPGLPLPLLIEPPVLLPVSTVDLQQGLQVVVVCLHILVIHVDVIQLLLLLKYLLRGAYKPEVEEART
jgi:hypothetical protein